MLTNNYTIYKLPENEEINLSGNEIKTILPSLNNRDLRLLKNDVRGDISYLVFKNDTILIKFDYIAVMIFNSHSYFIKFTEDYNSCKFVEYIKKSFEEYNNDQSFRIFIFELILNYLSEITDDFLEKSFKKASSLSINKFISKQLTDILKFQHSVLLEKNKNQEYYESLIELVKDKDNLEFFLRDRNNKNKKESEDIENFVNSYLNRIKEDIKNLDRLNREIHIFIELINVRLAEKRNNYASKTLNLEIFSCTYSLSCFFIFMFGTNLTSHIEDNNYAFYIIMFFIMLLHIPIFLIMRKIFK